MSCMKNIKLIIYSFVFVFFTNCATQLPHTQIAISDNICQFDLPLDDAKSLEESYKRQAKILEILHLQRQCYINIIKQINE